MMNIPLPENDRQSISVELQSGLEAIATQMEYKYSYRKYLQEWRTEDEVYVPSTSIPDTNLFLGFSSLNYKPSNVVAPPISIIAKEADQMVPKSRVFIITGRKGTGKSILQSNIVMDNFQRKFGVPILNIDPAPTGEFIKHKESLREQFISHKMNEMFNKYEREFNVQFKGYSIRTYKPVFDSMFQEEGVDVDWSLHLSDFKEMFNASKLDAMSALTSVVELSDKRTANAMAAQILANKNFKGFEDVTNALSGKTKVKGAEGDDDFKNIGTAFRNYLNEAMLLKVLSPGFGMKDNILNDLNNYDAVNIRSKSMATEDSKLFAKYFVYLQIALTRIISDRVRFSSGTAEEKKKCKLIHPYGLVISGDEFDQISPSTGNSYLKTLVQQVATKHRKSSISLCIATQNLSLLDPILVSQADGIFCSRLDSEGNIQALRKRGIDEMRIKTLRQLSVEKKNNYGFLVSEFAFINQKNEIQSFFPGLSLSSFKTQSN